MKFLPALPFTPWRIHQRLNDTLVTTRARRVYLAYPTSTRELIKNLSLNDTDDFEGRLSRNVLVSEQITWTSATSRWKTCCLSFSPERIFNLRTCSITIQMASWNFLHFFFFLQKIENFYRNYYIIFFLSWNWFLISLTIQFIFSKKYYLILACKLQSCQRYKNTYSRYLVYIPFYIY